MIASNKSIQKKICELLYILGIKPKTNYVTKKALVIANIIDILLHILKGL